MSAALAVQERPHTDLAELDGLIGWVLSAPVEEVCWRLTEIGNIRDWLRAQKEATELRMKAVRLELVALRKVALGGLANKISASAQLRSCAKWLASLTDEEFSNVLVDIDGDRSPIALYRADKAQRDAMRDFMRRGDSPSQWEHRATDDRYRRGEGDLRTAATALLSEILEAGEPFTVMCARRRPTDSARWSAPRSGMVNMPWNSAGGFCRSLSRTCGLTASMSGYPPRGPTSATWSLTSARSVTAPRRLFVKPTPFARSSRKGIESWASISLRSVST